MRAQGNRRPRGTGTITVKNDVYYGQWRVNGKKVKRSLGPVRKPHTSEGLTGTMAEARLRELQGEVTAPPPVKERYTVQDVGARLIEQRKLKGCKPTTVESYESYLRVHLAPFFAEQPLARITSEEIEQFVLALLDEGQSPKSVCNYLGLLHGIYDFAIRKGWALANPCKQVERPQAPDGDPEIRFLDEAELEAVIRAVPDDDLGSIESVMYRAAAMTGMRQGELLALRWMDVDWLAQKVRVRRSYSRGNLGTPKSKRSSRAVPLAVALARELELLFQRSAFQGDEDLVFAHPHTGGAMDRRRVYKRYKKTVKRAGVREVRFHDLRHTFGTRMAATPGVSMRMLQEWLGHRDIKTTLIYADYAPAGNEVDLVNDAFRGGNEGGKLRTTQCNSDPANPINPGLVN